MKKKGNWIVKVADQRLGYMLVHLLINEKHAVVESDLRSSAPKIKVLVLEKNGSYS